VRIEGKNLLAALCEMVGQSRTRRAHTKPWSIDRPGPEPLLWTNTVTKDPSQCLLVETRSMGPTTLCVEAITVLFSASLEALELLGSDTQTELWPGLVVAENFQPEFDVSGIEAPCSSARDP
jgi:hypothetical protein